MNMAINFQTSVHCVRALALAFFLVVFGSAVSVGDRSSAAKADARSDALMASFIAAVKSGNLSDAMKGSVASYLNSNPAGAANFVNQVISTVGVGAGAAGAALTLSVTNAITSVPGLSTTVQQNVGQGLGQAAGVLAVNGYAGAAKSILTGVPAGSSFATGLTTGMVEAAKSVPNSPVTGLATTRALSAAAAGTPNAGLTTGLASAAQRLGGLPQPTIVNPNQVSPCQAGSCN
jgi:hypothetical protein